MRIFFFSLYDNFFGEYEILFKKEKFSCHFELGRKSKFKKKHKVTNNYRRAEIIPELGSVEYNQLNLVFRTRYQSGSAGEK